MRRFLPFICLLLMLPLWGFGQNPAPKKQQKPLRVGLGLMATAYSGDLTVNGNAFSRFYPGANISFQFVGEKLIAPQFNIGFGKFVGQDRTIGTVEGIQPNSYVETTIFYLDFRLRFRFLREKRFNPYFAPGIGMLGYTPRDQDGNALLDNFSTRKDLETYGSSTPSFPLTIGFEVRMSQVLTLGLEYTHRPTRSDYLDNIGELGAKKGADKLNAITLSLLVTFDPNNPVNAGNLKGRD